MVNVGYASILDISKSKNFGDIFRDEILAEILIPEAVDSHGSYSLMRKGRHVWWYKGEKAETKGNHHVQVIQAVTVWSPNVGCHRTSHLFTIPSWGHVRRIAKGFREFLVRSGFLRSKTLLPPHFWIFLFEKKVGWFNKKTSFSPFLVGRIFLNEQWQKTLLM